MALAVAPLQRKPRSSRRGPSHSHARLRANTNVGNMLIRSAKQSASNPRGNNFSHGIILSYRISGLVVEYIVAIDVTRARFPADAPESVMRLCSVAFTSNSPAPIFKP